MEATAHVPDPDSGLDPVDWEAARRLGRELVDELFNGLETVRDRPAWRSVPSEVRARLEGPVPRHPEGLDAALADLRRDVLPYPYGNTHPRFWGWVNGSALVAGVLGDLAASALNANVGAFDHAAVFVEEQVLSWMKEMLAFPAETDGVLTSGGSLANLYGLAAARSAQLTFDVRKQGLAAAPKPPTVYGSLETHSSIKRAVELLGLGSDHLRLVPVDDDYRVDLAQLGETIRQDRAAGFEPLAVIGNAGTVNTGAIDDLDGLADLAEREGLWLHIDGAFGALAWLVPEQREALHGLQRADSVGFDLHKWMYLSSDVGCVLVRDPEALRRTFAFQSPYLMRMPGGIAARTTGSFMDRGMELTRRFRALKVWLALKEHGLSGFERAIRRNVEQARHLVRRIERARSLELLAPAPLNVVCFRYATDELEFEDLNHLNKELLVRLQESGAAVPSHTVLGGAFALRVAITNHRSELRDFDFLTDEVTRLGDQLVAEWKTAVERPAPDSSALCAVPSVDEEYP